MSDWKPIIGLEIHAELETRSKMFSACPVVDSVEAAPNTAVDPLSLGMPGTLPVINMQAMDFGMMVGLALNCEIPPVNQFSRKSYFYPDLPKGYQISQYDRPLAVNGYVDIELADGSSKRIRVRRAHMEEDTGKLTHWGGGGSLVDYNRAGVPLLEIVSEPDIFSAEEAEVYGRKIRAILRALGVNSGDMSKGVLRFEANVSVMHRTDTEFRTRTEIKNLNSLRNMYRAIEYEVARQIKLYESGATVKQATLGWDEAGAKVVIQRYKERPDEYRYFPEPDLPIVEVSREWVERVRALLPELPDAKKQRFMRDYGLTAYDATRLTEEKAVAAWYEAALSAGANAKTAANYMISSLFGIMSNNNIPPEDIASIRISPAAFAAVMQMVDSSQLNKGSAIRVLELMWEGGESAAAIVAREGLAQVSDSGAIAEAVAQVLATNDKMVQDYLSGKDKLFGALMGQCMKALGGKGNPAVVTDVLKAELEKLRG